jgi:C1A family cysteine protease
LNGISFINSSQLNAIVSKLNPGQLSSAAKNVTSGQLPLHGRVAKHAGQRLKRDIPTSFDWRDKNVLSPVRDQVEVF